MCVEQLCDILVHTCRMRLRKKTWRSPCTVFLDSQVFDRDVHVFANFEMYIECLEGKKHLLSLHVPSCTMVSSLSLSFSLSRSLTLSLSHTHTHTHTYTGPDTMKEPTQMQVYVRHWHPSTYTVDKTQEIILSDNSPEHLKIVVRIVMLKP